MTRQDGRKADELRKWRILRGVLDHAEGSALIEAGKTKVLCAASVDKTVPMFLKDKGRGWVTGEYSMLPRSTHTRSPRERNRVGGRTLEIQRMIGRSLRSIIDLKALGERTITVDCDVIQADGGTRVASITAGWVALHDACQTLYKRGEIPSNPLHDSVAAVSVGVVENELFLDLDYAEDSAAEVDMNVVFTGRGRLVEVQATAEGAPFSLNRMNELIRVAYRKGIVAIGKIQQRAVQSRAGAFPGTHL
ncbi:MAG: ribonuclease PH [Thermodesulfobacteriota bacterium]